MPKVILESKKEGQKTFTIFSLVTALLLASSVESEICPVEPQGSARGSSLLCEQRNEEKEGTPPQEKGATVATPLRPLHDPNGRLTPCCPS